MADWAPSGIRAEETLTRHGFKVNFFVSNGKAGDANYLTSPNIKSTIRSSGFLNEGVPLGYISFSVQRAGSFQSPVYSFDLQPFKLSEEFGRGVGTRLEILALKKFQAHLKRTGQREAFLVPHLDELALAREERLSKRGLVIKGVKTDSLAKNPARYFNKGKNDTLVSVSRMIDLAVADLRRMRKKNRIMDTGLRIHFGAGFIRGKKLESVYKRESIERLEAAKRAKRRLRIKNASKTGAVKFSTRKALIRTRRK
jgi:hypothetical protein